MGRRVKTRDRIDGQQQTREKYANRAAAVRPRTPLGTGVVREREQPANIEMCRRRPQKRGDENDNDEKDKPAGQLGEAGRQARRVLNLRSACGRCIRDKDRLRAPPRNRRL